MTTADAGRLHYTAEELLSEPDYEAPLYAGDVLCHGGFDADGHYRSPRTLHRNPAVAAWQARLEQDGVGLIQIADAQVPPQYPSVAQARLLLQHDVREPIVRALTVISILEGFGAIIRDVRIPDLSEIVVEPFDGTCLAHLGSGLFEAHARDEAGYRDRGGHKQMWEAARDLALDNPKVPPDVFMRLMGNRGRARRGDPLFPQIDPKLHRMLMTMAQVLVIEVFARGTFDWGEELLSDAEVSAEPDKAGAMVRYIRADESPHVEYLRTALSELRGRTLRTVDGGTIAGRTVIDGILHHILERVREQRPKEQRDDTRNALIAAIERGEARKSLLEEFDALSPSWQKPEHTGFEPAA
ncbi:MAG: hypothetical protein PVI30_24370 [Myxococcales bacterium]|jgi:hypothetical protein